MIINPRHFITRELSLCLMALLLAAACMKQWHALGCVIPRNLKKGLPTLHAFDNLDEANVSTVDTKHFHGNSLSAFQFPTAGELFCVM